METVAGLPLAGITAPILLLIGIWLILTGRLVPRRTYDDLLADRNEWREAHKISESQRETLNQQINSLLEVGKTVESIMHALPHPSDREARS